MKKNDFMAMNDKKITCPKCKGNWRPLNDIACLCKKCGTFFDHPNYIEEKNRQEKIKKWQQYFKNHPSIEFLKTPKRDQNTELIKFKIENKKYRICQRGDFYSFEWTNPNCRYFVHSKKFKSLDKAAKFIFTSDAP